MDDFEYYEALIVKNLDRETSPSEQEELQKWLDTDPLRRQEYRDLEKIWQDSGTALQRELFDKEAAWNKMQPAMQILPPGKPNKKAVLLKIKPLLAAASVLMIVLVSGWWYYSNRYNSISRVFQAENADQQISLPDGTRAWLRRGSMLRYAKSFNQKERQVEMSGEVFFEVAHGATAPFSVKTSHSLIEDIGTSFLVKAKESFDEIIVATGKVRVTDKGKSSNSLVLAEGESALLKENRFVRSAASDPNLFAWKTGILNFRDAPLDLALEEIGDYYNVVVRIPEGLKADAGHIRLTARFEKQPLREILEEIKLATGSQIRQVKDTLFFLRP